MMLKPLVCLVAATVPSLIMGGWTQEFLQFEGNNRTYHVYTPSSNAGDAGLMMFLHGDSMGVWDEDAALWDVANNAEQFGFIGVVPTGTPYPPRPIFPKEAYYWNIDDPNGPNEVEFIKEVTAAVVVDKQISEEVPKIAFGFSNGAGLSALVGCHNSDNLWVAHIAVHINMDADYPSTCDSRTSSTPDWNAVGDRDFFIASLQPTPVEGVFNQFAALRESNGCPPAAAVETSGDGFQCAEYPGCEQLGQLCVYSNSGHVIEKTMTKEAWEFLAL